MKLVRSYFEEQTNGRQISKRSSTIFSENLPTFPALASCLQGARRERDVKNLEAGDFGNPLRRRRRYQSQNGGGYLSVNQPIDRRRLTLAELDFRRPRCNDRGPDTAVGRRIPVVDRNHLAGQIGDRRDVGRSHENGNQKVCVIGRRR